MKEIKVLVVDDDIQILDGLKSAIEKKFSYAKVSTAYDGQMAYEILMNEGSDLIISDWKMPKMDGMELFRKSKEQNPNSVFIMITAWGTIDSAVEAMKYGTYDYMSKPFSHDDILLKVKNAINFIKAQTEKSNLQEIIKSTTQKGGEIIWKSEKMKKILELIKKVAPNNSTVLITGESGTGKELVARAIHNKSKRKEKLFVAVNCAALPKDLLESELFGHEKGAFTDAKNRQIGKFEQADGGTIFLDEIGDMDISLQAKILRVIQERGFYRVGGNAQIKVDVRIILATNQDLATAVKEKMFREDLFHRINVFPIHLPPLRQRKDDISLLAEYFIKTKSGEIKKTVNDISKDALSKLMEYDFPGNVRELENIIERAIILCDGNEIKQEHITIGDISKPQPNDAPHATNTLEEAKNAFNKHGGSDKPIKLKNLIEETIRNFTPSELPDRLSTTSLTKTLSTTKDKINRAVKDSNGSLVYAVLEEGRIQKCESRNKPKNCFICPSIKSPK